MLLDYKELIIPEETQIIKKTVDFFAETWSDILVEKSYYLADEKELHIHLKNGTQILLTIQNFTEKI
jgi:hypothetical protein